MFLHCCCVVDGIGLVSNFSCLGCGDNCQIARIIINYVCTNIHGAHPGGCDQSLDRVCWVTNIYVFCVGPIHIHWNLCQHLFFWLPHEMTWLQTRSMNTCHHQWEMEPGSVQLTCEDCSQKFQVGVSLMKYCHCLRLRSGVIVSPVQRPGGDTWKMAKLYQMAWWEGAGLCRASALSVSCYSCLWCAKCSYKQYHHN